jgi:hypothetical protein
MTKAEIIREHYSQIGKKGGKKGGRTRMDALTPKQRTALAKKAAATRWGNRATGGQN